MFLARRDGGLAGSRDFRKQPRQPEGDSLARARALAKQLDRPEYFVRLSLGQWAFHLHRSEHKLALSLAEQVEKFGEARNDATVQLRVGAQTG